MISITVPETITRRPMRRFRRHLLDHIIQLKNWRCVSMSEKRKFAARMMGKRARQRSGAAHAFSIAGFRCVRRLLGAILNGGDNRGSPSLSATLMGQNDWPVAGENGSALQNSRSRWTRPARPKKAKGQAGSSRSARQAKRTQPRRAG